MTEKGPSAPASLNGADAKPLTTRIHLGPAPVELVLLLGRHCLSQQPTISHLAGPVPLHNDDGAGTDRRHRDGK